MSERQGKIDRRTWLKVAGGTGLGLVVGGVVGWSSRGTSAPMLPTNSTVTTGPSATGLTGQIMLGFLHADAGDAGVFDPAYQMGFEDVNNWLSSWGAPFTFTQDKEIAEGSETKAVERVQTMIGRGIQIIIGPNWSSECKALLSLVNNSQVVLLSPGSSSPDLAIPDDYLFRLQPDNNQQARAMGRYPVDRGIKAAIAVYANEPFGQSLWQASAARWKELGVDVLPAFGIDPTKKEFVTEMSTVNQEYVAALKTYKKNEIGIFLVGTYQPIIPLLTALVQYPDLATAVVFDSNNGGNTAITDSAGKAAASVGLQAYGIGNPESPKLDDFVTRYTARTGFAPFGEGVSDYDAIWIAALSIIAAGKYSGPAIKAVLPQIANSFYGASGWCALNDAGDRKYFFGDFFQVVTEGGKPVWKKIGYYDGSTDRVTFSSP